MTVASDKYTINVKTNKRRRKREKNKQKIKQIGKLFRENNKIETICTLDYYYNYKFVHTQHLKCDLEL